MNMNIEEIKKEYKKLFKECANKQIDEETFKKRCLELDKQLKQMKVKKSDREIILLTCFFETEEKNRNEVAK